MNMSRVAALLAISLVSFACGNEPEPEEEAPNPLTCAATNDDVTLTCNGTGAEGALYECLCARPFQFISVSCSADSQCDVGNRCIDGLCNDVATFTDLTICIDGISAEEVAERCSGLPG